MIEADEIGSAWKEAYLALRAYYSNNNGANARRKRDATEKLIELKLLSKAGGLKIDDQ
ncbi:MAG: hypothetical protein QGM45_12080 [Anaerolineales bacterium]|nr:hypothetical protein [Anaerolineales bacterium]